MKKVPHANSEQKENKSSRTDIRQYRLKTGIITRNKEYFTIINDLIYEENLITVNIYVFKQQRGSLVAQW